jgi:glutaredoxin
MFASETSVAAPLACPLRALRRIAFGIALSLAALGQAAAADSIEAFVREGCPHCAAAEEFLAQLGKERPELSISIRDVQKDAAAMQRLQDLVREHGGAARVPAIYVGGQLIVGFSESANTGQLIRSALAGQRAANPSASAAADDGASCEADEHALECKRPAAAEAQFSVTLFGRTLTLADVGLPAFTLAMGLLDGFNPCSMWVLLLMISIIAPLNDRPRMLAIAGTFVLVEGIAYFVFMAAWLNLFLLIGISRPVTLLVAAIAIIAGLINLKDFVAFGRGISLSIPERAKPGICRRRHPGAADPGRGVHVHVRLSGAVHAHPDAAAGRHRRILRLYAAVHRRLHAGRHHRARHRRCAAVAPPAAGTRRQGAEAPQRPGDDRAGRVSDRRRLRPGALEHNADFLPCTALSDARPDPDRL